MTTGEQVLEGGLVHLAALVLEQVGPAAVRGAGHGRGIADRVGKEQPLFGPGDLDRFVKGILSGCDPFAPRQFHHLCACPHRLVHVRNRSVHRDYHAFTAGAAGTPASKYLQYGIETIFLSKVLNDGRISL